VAKASKPKTVGRPKKPIDERAVARLAFMALTVEQIGTILQCDHKTIERNFGPTIKRQRDKLCHQLRYKLYQKANDGDTACLIFLGKCLAGLKEPREDPVNVHVNTVVQQNNLKAITPELRQKFWEIDEALRKEVTQTQLENVRSGNGDSSGLS
jgi:hypothetical protein